jgi:hypothetical protein
MDLKLHQGRIMYTILPTFIILGENSVLGICISCSGKDYSASHNNRSTEYDTLGITLIFVDQNTCDRGSSQASEADDKR